MCDGPGLRGQGEVGGEGLIKDKGGPANRVPS